LLHSVVTNEVKKKEDLTNLTEMLEELLHTKLSVFV